MRICWPHWEARLQSPAHQGRNCNALTFPLEGYDFIYFNPRLTRVGTATA